MIQPDIFGVAIHEKCTRFQSTNGVKCGVRGWLDDGDITMEQHTVIVTERGELKAGFTLEIECDLGASRSSSNNVFLSRGTIYLDHGALQLYRIKLVVS